MQIKNLILFGLTSLVCAEVATQNENGRPHDVAHDVSGGNGVGIADGKTSKDGNKGGNGNGKDDGNNNGGSNGENQPPNYVDKTNGKHPFEVSAIVARKLTLQYLKGIKAPLKENDTISWTIQFDVRSKDKGPYKPEGSLVGKDDSQVFEFVNSTYYKPTKDSITADFQLGFTKKYDELKGLLVEIDLNYTEILTTKGGTIDPKSLVYAPFIFPDGPNNPFYVPKVGITKVTWEEVKVDNN